MKQENEKRSKKAEDIQKRESQKKVYTVGSAKIELDKNKVSITTPFKKVVYLAKGVSPEYYNWSLLFDDGQSDADRKEYATILLGLETLSNYAHSDATLAAKLYDEVVKRFNEILLSIEPRDDNEEEYIKDARDFIATIDPGSEL